MPPIPDNDKLLSESSDSEASTSDSSSESDHLDSADSRKRRRITEKTAGAIPFGLDNDDSDSDDYGAPISLAPGKSLFSTPATRIQKKGTVVATATAGAEEGKETPVQPDVYAANPIQVATDQTIMFASLSVKPWLVQSLANMAIKRPTGIQKACIPEILSGRDCIGGSRTGSGKTIAFAVPMLQKCAEDPSAIFGLILTPTRELALQILEQYKAIAAAQTLRIILVTGGADMREQAIALAKRPHIIIATPGRLADHIRTSGEDTICGLRRVKYVVLDEADRLLHAKGSGSMLPDVEECLGVLPPPTERQTLLFTATMTAEVKALQNMPVKPGKKPVFVCEVDTQMLAVPQQLKQMHLKVPVTHKEHYLHMFLLTPKNADKTIIIFCNRTSTANFLHHMLRLLEHRVTSLHSGLPQRQRTDNLGRFRAAAARILVATDVAARGLDIPEVSLVINYDVPRDPDDYIHRVGRTARAGRSGEAVTMVGQRDVELVLAIEERVGRQMVEWEEERVNLETRVLKDGLKVVSEKKREALLEVEENREVGGKRKRGKQKMQA